MCNLFSTVIKLIIEAYNHRLEKTSKISKSNHPPNNSLLNHIPKHRIYASFKHFQGWELHHVPGQPIPMPDHSFQ